MGSFVTLINKIEECAFVWRAIKLPMYLVFKNREHDINKQG